MNRELLLHNALLRRPLASRQTRSSAHEASETGFELVTTIEGMSEL